MKIARCLSLLAALPSALLAQDELALRLKPALDAGHAWLKKHQDDDGRFSASMFLVHDPKGQSTDGPGKPDQDVFVTALVVRASFGMGWMPDQAESHPHLCKAIRWLRTQVRVDGSVGLPHSQTLVRDTVIGADVLRRAGQYDSAQQALFEVTPTLVWLERVRLADGRWPRRAGGEADWVTGALATMMVAKAAPARILGEGPFVVDGKLRARTPEEGAAAAFVAAWYLENPQWRREGSELALQRLPARPTEGQPADYLAWYFATQALQFEGADKWDRWWRALAEAALAMQRQDGAFAGSWDPIDVRGRECGRVYSSAAMLLALEVVWRKEVRDR